jgi:hypothetical protein
VWAAASAGGAGGRRVLYSSMGMLSAVCGSGARIAAPRGAVSYMSLVCHGAGEWNRLASIPLHGFVARFGLNLRGSGPPPEPDPRKFHPPPPRLANFRAFGSPPEPDPRKFNPPAPRPPGRPALEPPHIWLTRGRGGSRCSRDGRGWSRTICAGFSTTLGRGRWPAQDALQLREPDTTRPRTPAETPGSPNPTEFCDKSPLGPKTQKFGTDGLRA